MALERGFFTRKQSTLSSDSGFTLLELLVSSIVSMLMIGMTISLTLSARELFFYDLTRVELQQNLRGAIDLIGIDIREGGERLNSTFPAILVNDGGTTTSDELILRRNLLDEVLVVCADIPAGSGLSELPLSDAASTVAACTYGAQESSINAWEGYRTGQGGVIKVYIYDLASKAGEWIEYQSMSDSGTDLFLGINPHTFTNSYSANSTSIYVLEERRYRVSNGLLQLFENDDTANPLNVAFGISTFEVTARLEDGTTQSTLAESDDWASLDSLEVSLTGSIEVLGKAGTLAGNTITRSVTSRFLPRNVLSN